MPVAASPASHLFLRLLEALYCAYNGARSAVQCNSVFALHSLTLHFLKGMGCNNQQSCRECSPARDGCYEGGVQAAR